MRVFDLSQPATSHPTTELHLYAVLMSHQAGGIKTGNSMNASGISVFVLLVHSKAHNIPGVQGNTSHSNV